MKLLSIFKRAKRKKTCKHNKRRQFYQKRLQRHLQTRSWDFYLVKILFFIKLKETTETIKPPILRRSPGSDGPPTWSNFEHSFHRFSAFGFRLVSPNHASETEFPISTHATHSIPWERSHFTPWQHFFLRLPLSHTHTCACARSRSVLYGDATLTHLSTQAHAASVTIPD